MPFWTKPPCGGWLGTACGRGVEDTGVGVDSVSRPRDKFEEMEKKEALSILERAS